jgi:hypothetical protein
MIRKAMLTACFSCALGLLSFGLAEPFDPPNGKQQEAKEEKARNEAQNVRRAVEGLVAAQVQVMEKKKVDAAKKESKTPIADLLNAAVNELTGKAAQPAAPKAAPKAVAVKQQVIRVQAGQKMAVKKAAPAQVKAAPKKESKTPVADLLGAALDGLFGGGNAGQAAVAVAVPQAVFVNNVNNNDAFVKQMEQQYGARMKQLQRSELHFMRQVCQPTKEQFQKIEAAGDAEMNANIKKLAKTIADQRMGRARGNANPPDSRKQITSGLVNKVKETLSPEQAANYEKELDERAAARRRFVVTGLVWAIDKRLVLSQEQREKIAEVLMKNYKNGWNDIQLIMQGGQYFPSMPDDKINPLLTDTQKAIWRGVQKGNVFFGNNELDWFQGVEVDAEVWVDAGAKK